MQAIRTKPKSAPADLARLPIGLNLRAISLSEGLRAALSVAVIIALNEYLGWPALAEAAIAALWTCLCDPGGPIRRRVPILLTFAVAGAIVTPAVGLLRGFGLPVGLPVGALALFALSFLRIYGQPAQQVGNLLSFAVILALDHPLPGIAAALVIATAFIAGALWAVLLTIVVWRVHPFMPARRAVSDVYRRLAELTGDLRNALVAGVDAAAWERHARAHRGAVRTAIEAARAVVFDTARSRGMVGVRGSHTVIRLEAADQIFGALIALSELAEAGSRLERGTSLRLLRRLQPLLVLLGRAALAAEGTSDPRLSRAIDAMAADIASLPQGDPLTPLALRIIERLRIAVTLAAPQNFLPGTDPAGRPPPWRVRWLLPIKANLTWQSPALRHAVRIVVVATPALAFTMLHFDEFDHWLTISIVASMQPYFAVTWTGALQRTVGTALGGVAAAVIGLLCTTPLAIAAAMFPLAVASFAVRAVSLGLFFATLTPLIVLLVESLLPGTSEWSIALARFALTAGGGLIAVAAGFLLWPTWEPERLGQEARAAIGAHAAYADAVLGALAGEIVPAAVDVARRRAGLASNNLEASISRALTEPSAAGRERLEASLLIDAALRRMAGRLSAIQLDPSIAPMLPPEQRTAWRGWIDAAAGVLMAGGNVLPPRPATGAPDALLRVARQVELMAGAMQRLVPSAA